MKIISETWKSNIISNIQKGIKIDETVSFNKAIQWLIVKLTHHSIPFTLYNLGAGVKRITTDTDTCPCCKRKL